MRRESAGFTRAAVPLFVLLLLTACFEIEQDIVVDRNLSGTADLEIGVDFEPMIVIMAQMGRQMEGKEGPPSEAELDKLRTDFKEKSASEKNEPPNLAEMNKEMPKGVRVLAADAKADGLRFVSNFRFEFDRLSNLVEMKLPSKEETDPTKKNVIDSPFQGLVVTEKGDIITIRSKPQNPADKVEEQAAGEGPAPDPEMVKMMEDAFKNLRFAFRITAPFEIVSHNATRQDGKTLIWEYDLKRFEEMAKAGGEELEIQVSYRR